MPFNDDYQPDILVRGIDENQAHWEQIADYSDALSHSRRVKYLTGLANGQTQAEIAEELGIASSQLHSDHRDKLKDGELLYEPSEIGVAVAVTPLGHYTMGGQDTSLRDVLTTFQMLEQAEEEYKSNLDQGESNPHTWKWEDTWNEIQDHLGVESTRYRPEK